MSEGMQSQDIRETAKLTKWEKEPTLLQLKQDYQDAKPYHDSCISQIEEWLDNLHIRGKAKIRSARRNVSRVQPKLIRKQAEWRYAALSEPFLSTPDIFTINPVSFEDVKSSYQNALVLNNQFNTKINKVEFIDEYVRAAVDEGTVIVRVGWETVEEQYDEMGPDVKYFTSPEFAPMLEQLMMLKSQNPAEYYLLPDYVRTAVDLSIEQGEPVEPQIVGQKKVTKTRTIKNQPCLEICDPRNVLIDPTCKGDIKKAGFLIYHFESSLSALKKDGRYKNLDKINVETNTILGDPDHATPDDHAKNFNFSDEPRKKFVVYEYWGFRDLDGSGTVRPFVAAWVGNTIIRMEENPFPDKQIPFVKAQYLPVRKHIYGEPDGALLEDNQAIIGAVTRGMIDLMGRSANAQQGIRKDALDPVNRRKFEEGKDYEFNPTVADPRQAIFMHTYPEIPASAQFMIALQNQEAESMTGVKAFHGGLSGDSLGKVATGVRGVLDAASKRELGILRRLSQGLIDIARKIIAMNGEFLDEEEVVRVTNEEFVVVRRDDLAGNFDLRLGISTAEEDNAKAQELAFMLQTAGPNEDPGLRKMILSAIMRLRKMPDLAKAIESYEPQPDPVQQQIQMLQVQKLEAEIDELRARAQERLGNSQLHQSRAGMEAEKAANLRSQTDKLNLDFIEQESGVTQERELQKTAEQARSQVALKMVDRAFEVEDRQADALKDYIKQLEKKESQVA